MVVPGHRPGGQAQYVETPLPQDGADSGLAAVLDWARAHLDQPLSVPELARRAHMSPRTFARRFGQITGTTPYQWLLEARLEHVEHLLQGTDLPVDQGAHAARLGSADTLRHHFAKRRRTSPLAYRRAFRGDAAAS